MADAIETRLYYEDASLREFDARVIEQFEVDGGVGVVLDRTAFYPTSGGQPHDIGRLNGLPVTDVYERIPDDAVVHVIDRRLTDDTAHGVIDWARRFDLMQQHTGQHVLSHAFEALLDADTVGFHLTGESLTIDVNRAPLSAGDLEAVEQRANEMIWADLPVRAAFLPKDEVARLPLRKPPSVTGPIRIVRIADSDFSPCGGTHCSSTGAVGQILVRKAERRGGETRIDFVCGSRALNEARGKVRLVAELASQFSVGDRDLGQAVARLSEEARSCRRDLKAAEERLLDVEADELYGGGERVGDARLVVAGFSERAPGSAKHLALRLMSRPRCVALFGAAVGDAVQLTFARSDDVPLDVRPLLREACRLVGGGGGGQPNLAQGGGTRPADLQTALQAAAQAARTQLQT